MDIGATLAQNSDFEIEIEVPTTHHPRDVITNRIIIIDDDGTIEDPSDPLVSYPKLTNYQLSKDRSRRSIVPPKRYYNFLFYF